MEPIIVRRETHRGRNSIEISRRLGCQHVMSETKYVQRKTTHQAQARSISSGDQDDVRSSCGGCTIINPAHTCATDLLTVYGCSGTCTRVSGHLLLDPHQIFVSARPLCLSVRPGSASRPTAQ